MKKALLLTLAVASVLGSAAHGQVASSPDLGHLTAHEEALTHTVSPGDPCSTNGLLGVAAAGTRIAQCREGIWSVRPIIEVLLYSPDGGRIERRVELEPDATTAFTFESGRTDGEFLGGPFKSDVKVKRVGSTYTYSYDVLVTNPDGSHYAWHREPQAGDTKREVSAAGARYPIARGWSMTVKRTP